MAQFFLSLVVFIVLTVNALQAQFSYQAGPRLGVNAGTIYLETSVEGFVGDDQTDLGYVLGAYVRLNFGQFHLQPEFGFSQKRLKQNFETGEEYSLRLDDLDAALLLGYSVVNSDALKLRLQLGPVISTNISASERLRFEGDSFTNDPQEVLEHSRFGFAAGIGVDIRDLTLDLRYYSSVQDVFLDELGIEDLVSRPRGLQFALGYHLFQGE